MSVTHALTDIATMTRRDLLRTAQQPDQLVFGATMGVFFLLLFYWVFGGVIAAGSDVDYAQYLVPGVLVVTALTGAQVASLGVAADLREGFVDRLRTLPITRSSLLSGSVVADALRNLVAVLLVAAVGHVLGFRFASPVAAVGVVALSVALGVAFSWLNNAAAARVRDPQLLGMLGMFWLFPLMFASSIFTPIEQMPGWLQAFARNQPVSVVTDALRALSDGTAAAGDVWPAIAWLVGLTAVGAVAATRAFRRPTT